ncbi:MAG: hypothetical protein QX197_15410 [Methylococcaceae bacterium]
MFFLLRSLIIGFIALLLVLSLLLSQLLETSPKNPQQWQANAQFARVIFKKASTQTQGNQDLSLDQAELNHIANSILNRYLVSTTLITLQDDNIATITATLHLAKKLQGYYLNIQFKLDNQNDSLNVSELHIGQLKIPQRMTNLLISTILQHSVLKQYYLLGAQHIQTIQIKNHQLIARYVLNSAGIVNANTINPESVAFYQQHLELITAQHNPNWRLSLADLLQPLFKLAYEHSTLKNAITENIAIMVAVSAYVSSNEIPFYLALKQPVSTQHQYPVFLYKRTDQAKHFMLSAVLTITGGSGFADFMGQEKELRDAQSSSGFSFIDLAADRAGMKFSEQATYSPGSAKELQRVMAYIKDYSAFMPETKDLPENLSRTEFTDRFDAIDSKRYQDLLRKIDDRITALPLYQTVKRE